MRYFLGLILLFSISASYGETFRCVGKSGEIIVSDTACDEGERFSKIRPSESSQDTEAARRELAKQKAYADRVAAENEAARKSKEGALILPDQSSPPPTSGSELSFPSSSGGSGGGGGSASPSGGVSRGIPHPSAH